jgi:hypothetical protein
MSCACARVRVAQLIVDLQFCRCMVLSFSVVYAAVATVTRFRVLEALLEIVKEIVGKIVRF